MIELNLAFGLRFNDLYERAGLELLDTTFLSALPAPLAERLKQARSAPETLAAKEESQLILDLAGEMDAFIATLFGITEDVRELQKAHSDLAPLWECRKHFILRRATRAIEPHDAAELDGGALQEKLTEAFGEDFSEIAYARHVMAWLENEAGHTDEIDLAIRYAAWAIYTHEGHKLHKYGVLFQYQKKLDFADLVDCIETRENGISVKRSPESQRIERNGFALLDHGSSLANALGETKYCLLCWQNGRDSCSHGFPDPKTGALAQNTFGTLLEGCPLGQKISEMNEAKSRGMAIGALGIICIDNPMPTGTGHRICTTCMKACIFQKVEPVNIPTIETRTLNDVLSLPWGFEIHSLLTRWNPLNIRRPLPKPDSGYKVLVVGQGPAGYTLAHHLLNEGHAVAAVDGFKIEPLDADVCGRREDGRRVPFSPIAHVEDIRVPMENRIPEGFGGASEYGITARWDKNNLKITRLILERRKNFALFGGVCFGSTLTFEDALDMGFDHIALATGAGRPTLLSIKNIMARGVRQASDFLMSLQLSGAALPGSLTNLEIRMPIAVIGGGLTAIDSATESLAYYPLQVERFLSRYETLVAKNGKEAVETPWSAEERETAEEFLTHARAIRMEKAAADKENRSPRILDLLDSWGGSTIVYRKDMRQAPSYTLNHAEIEKAMEEGVRFMDEATPVAIKTDRHGHAEALQVTRGPSRSALSIPARTILVAAGTRPNTLLAEESSGILTMDGRNFAAINENGDPITPEHECKAGDAPVLAAKTADGRFISFHGDAHPTFAGSVSRAMASAKRGYPVISRVLSKTPATPKTASELFGKLDAGLRPTVASIRKLGPDMMELVIKAPMAAAHFQPGQFFRLQNHVVHAQTIRDTFMTMEGLAMAGAWVDREQGLVSLLVRKHGASSHLCALLKEGEPVVLMGPLGKPLDIPENTTACLISEGASCGCLSGIAETIREKGGRVLFLASGLDTLPDSLKDHIKKSANTFISVPAGKDMVSALLAHAEGNATPEGIPLKDCDRIFAMGSARMMAEIAQARKTVLSAHIKPDHIGLAAINAPMQCMMKEICAQCLQTVHDPKTGEEHIIYACKNQNQAMDEMDWGVLQDRLGQNSLSEKLTAQWIDLCLKDLT